MAALWIIVFLFLLVAGSDTFGHENAITILILWLIATAVGFGLREKTRT